MRDHEHNDDTRDAEGVADDPFAIAEDFFELPDDISEDDAAALDCPFNLEAGRFSRGKAKQIGPTGSGSAEVRLTIRDSDGNVVDEQHHKGLQGVMLVFPVAHDAEDAPEEVKQIVADMRARGMKPEVIGESWQLTGMLSHESLMNAGNVVLRWLDQNDMLGPLMMRMMAQQIAERALSGDDEEGV